MIAGVLFLISAAVATPDTTEPTSAASATEATDGAALPGFALDIEVEAAEGIREPLNRAAPSASVIGPAEIRASGVTTVGELLRRVAGVDVSRNGSQGKVTTARIDGAASTQTLVLVDGMELNSPTLALADLADLTLDNVERIEVVRGPMSALYGSQAMGGVISVVTRRGSGDPRTTLELAGGSYGTLRGGVSSHGSAGHGVGYSLSASGLDSDGRRIENQTGAVENDGYERYALAAGITAALPHATALEIDGRLQDGDRELPIEAFSAQTLDVNSSQTDRTGVLSLRLRARQGSAVEPFLRAGYTGSKQHFDDPLDPGEDGPFATDFSARTTTAVWTVTGGVDARLAEHDLLTLGGEWERRDGKNSDNLSGESFDRNFDTGSFYAQNRFEAESPFADGDRLVLTAGARVDHASSFGTEVNPKLSLLWTAPSDVFRLRAGAGRGFRAPSLNELFFPFFGNPDLEPETSRTYEVAAGTRAGGGRFDAELRYFHTDFDDLITSDPDTFLAINLARARAHGVELEMRATPLSGLWLHGSATFQKAEDRDSDDELLRRPRKKGALGIAYERPSRYRAALDLTLTGSQADIRLAGFPERNPSWGRLDAAGAYTLPFAGRRLELLGRIENLLDSEFSEAAGYPAPGINGELGIRARF